MKLPRRKNGWFALMLGVVSIVAFAETPASVQVASSSTRQWTTADKDRDGLLSWEELLPFPAFSQDFAGMDADSDGKISRTEYASWRNARKID